MKYLLILLAGLITTGCYKETFTEKNMEVSDRGIRTCTSNQERPNLRFDTSTLKITMYSNGVGILEFRELDSGKIYRLHSVEDRDYDCSLS